MQPKLRWWLVGLLFVSTIINSVDRQTFSILAHEIQKTLHITDVGYAGVVQLFLISYTLAYLLTGRVTDRLGSKLSMTIFIAPSKEYGELLGHSLYFYSKDTGRPVRFVPPRFALKDITAIPRYRDIRAVDSGCRFWWFEYGGRLDTVHQTEDIKWELWKVAYGVWNYIKNSGRFPEAETRTLEWVGAIPGKRESRRFEGDYILTQQDIVCQRTYPDAVSVGGWAIDLHPGDGVYSELPSCTQWHSKGVYQIPYRCF